MADTVQLDLFGEVEASHTRRLVDALVCLRDAVPEAMYVVVHLCQWKRPEDRSIGKSGDWAYTIRNAGLRYEHVDDWGRGAYERGETWGWSRTPVRLVTWAELSELVGGDPRRQTLVDWFHNLTEPDRWRDIYRPFELWPHPETWHPDYIAGDHERPGWDARSGAWRELQAILTDAAKVVVA